MLTPNSIILGRDIKLTDDSPEEEEVSDNWKKRQRYVHKCKETAWKRWVHEYLTAFKGRHNLSHKEKPWILWMLLLFIGNLTQKPY